MKSLILLIIVPLLSLALIGCPSSETKSDKDQSAAEDKNPSAEGDKNPEELPEDVQKKLKSLGYVQ